MADAHTPKRARRAAPDSLRITAFFANRLHAPVLNARWSWGAFDPSTNTIFLRVWSDEEHDLEGRRAYRIVDDEDDGEPKSATRVLSERERAEHIERIREGAASYGVLCVSKEPNTRKRAIERFDDQTLLVLGELIVRGGCVYAIVAGETPVDAVLQRAASWSDEARDVEAIRRDGALKRTTRDALIEARLGQGVFRDDVLSRWGRACALTGCAFEPLLRASHIKPWGLATNKERLDPSNGLPLAAHVDALFDRGFISFSDAGELLASPHLPADALALLGGARALRRAPNAREQAFLAYHRAELFGRAVVEPDSGSRPPRKRRRRAARP